MYRHDSPPDPKVPIAVALHHDFGSEEVPRVVASGRGAVAERILELAFAHGVKVREDSDLAQLLSVIDIDSEVPPEAFAAIAEVLAYLYKANGQARAPETETETLSQSARIEP